MAAVRYFPSFARDKVGRAFLVLAGCYYLFGAVAPLTHATRVLGLRRFHQRLPFFAWAVLQPLPLMFSFGNQVVVTPPGNPGPKFAKPFWVIHHPMRAIYAAESDIRGWRFELTSRYQSTALTTTYRVDEAYRLVMEGER